MCNLKPACFSTNRDVYFMQQRPNVSSVEGKDMILLSIFFDDYLIHSTAFSDEKLLLLCSGSHRGEFEDIVLCVYLLSAEIFFCLWPTSKRFPLWF